MIAYVLKPLNYAELCTPDFPGCINQHRYLFLNIPPINNNKQLHVISEFYIITNGINKHLACNLHENWNMIGREYEQKARTLLVSCSSRNDISIKFKVEIEAELLIEVESKIVEVDLISKAKV